MTLEENGPAALAHMEQALELLDQCEAPGEVGCNLDLAICRLRDVLDGRGRMTLGLADARRMDKL